MPKNLKQDNIWNYWSPETLKKCVRKNDVVDTIHFRVCFELRIYVEEDLKNHNLKVSYMQKPIYGEINKEPLDLSACQFVPQGEVFALRSKNIVFYWSKLRPENYNVLIIVWLS